MTDSSQRPTRVVRARDLAQGDVVLRDCPDRTLTILDAEVHDGEVSVIYIAESGEQCGTSWREWCIVRVYADTPARTQAAGDRP